MSETSTTSMLKQALPVFLRGERSYVQGTQIIARLAAQVAPAGSRLIQATFSRITANTVCWLAPESGEADQVIGQVHFVRDAQEQTYRLLDSGEAAPRMEASMNIQLALVNTTGPLAGQYHVEIPGDLEALLNAMVQAVKALHEQLDPSVHDVWFTGMRQFALPVEAQPETFSGAIEIRHRRLLRRGQQYQSLVDLTVRDHDGQPCHQGVFNFAFKSEKVIHVD